VAEAIADYDSVRQWARGLREQWGDEPDMEQRYAVLQRFADFAGKDPDTMILECTRDVDSGKRIRIKARREYTEKIAAYQTTVEGNRRQQSKAANFVRSFFIHNGIFMQAGLSE
jgi:hypothetical protein